MVGTLRFPHPTLSILRNFIWVLYHNRLFRQLNFVHIQIMSLFVNNKRWGHLVFPTLLLKIKIT